MRTYKLLKDYQTRKAGKMVVIPAGEVATREPGNSIYEIKWNGDIYAEVAEVIENNPEWFEEAKEEKKNQTAWNIGISPDSKVDIKYKEDCWISKDVLKLDPYQIAVIIHYPPNDIYNKVHFMLFGNTYDGEALKTKKHVANTGSKAVDDFLKDETPKEDFMDLRNVKYDNKLSVPEECPHNSIKRTLLKGGVINIHRDISANTDYYCDDCKKWIPTEEFKEMKVRIFAEEDMIDFADYAFSYKSRCNAVRMDRSFEYIFNTWEPDVKERAK